VNQQSYLAEVRKNFPADLSLIAAEIAHLKALDNWEPLGIKGAAVLIETLAATMQVPVPNDTGLTMYIEAIKDLPGGPAKRGLVHVVKNHRYKNLPLVSEIISATYADSTYNQLVFAERQIRLTEAERKVR